MFTQRRNLILASVLMSCSAVGLAGVLMFGALRPAAQARSPIRELRSSGALMLDGYCPVSLVEQRKWIRGRPDYRTVHDGCEYRFASQDDRQRFLAEPVAYVPVLRGYDVTEYVDAHKLVPGRRGFGVTYRRRIYLFKDEAALWLFERHPAEFEVRVAERLAKGNPFLVH